MRLLYLRLRDLGRISPDIWARFAVIFPLLIYQLCYFKAYFPITEGWFSTYAWLIRQGQTPHLDFNLLVPALYSLHIALVQWLFGENIFVLRCLGVLVTCGIGLALYECLNGFFNRWSAAFSAVAAIIYYQTGNAFIGYDFTQFLTLYIFIGGAFLVRSIEGIFAGIKDRHVNRIVGAAGFFLGLAVLIKQSNGGLTALCAGVTYIAIILRVMPLNRGLNHIAWFVVGGILPTAFLLFWLSTQGAFQAFFDQVFFAALAAKGGTGAVFSGWIRGFFAGGQYPLMAGLLARRLFEISGAIAATIIFIRLAVALAVRKMTVFHAVPAAFGLGRIRGLPIDYAAPVLCYAGLAILCYLILHIYAARCAFCDNWRDNIAIIYNSVILLSLHIYLIGFLTCFTAMLFIPRLRSAQFLILCALGVGLTIGNGTSAGLSEISALLGLAIAQAALLQWSLPYVLPAVIPATLSLALSGYLIEKKFENPYYWWSVVSRDVRSQTCAESAGILRYICVDPVKYDKIEQVVNDIRTYTQPGDAIYIFPHLPIFHLLSGRPPFAGAVVSWFDFMSDAEAAKLNAVLHSAPPKLIIVARLPEEVYAAHERLFRGGQYSVQRELIQTIDSLANIGTIRRVDILTDLDGLTVEVYVRGLQSS